MKIYLFVFAYCKSKMTLYYLVRNRKKDKSKTTLHTHSAEPNGFTNLSCKFFLHIPMQSFYKAQPFHLLFIHFLFSLSLLNHMMKGSCHNEDYISFLPDDILVSVLSRLSIKEAGLTSCLSRRWRYLWTTVSGLDLDADDKLNRIAAEPKVRSGERSKYTNWVNRVVRNYRGLTLEAFRICFDLEKGSKVAIDNWVKFAIAKRVQRLELDLLENGETLRQPLRNYTFPFKVLSQSKGSSLKHLYPNSPDVHSCHSIGLKALKALSLKCVNVSDEALQYFLSNCPFLQCLSIHGSGDLANVKVTGMHLKLNCLEIVFCLDMKTIEIYDTNLVSFSYLGTNINLFINNVPMLDEVSIGEGYSGIENDVFSQLSSCMYQLEILTLDIYRPEENMKIFAFPELPYLKQLILKVGAWADDCLLEFTSLVRACPNLYRFVLQLIWMSPSKRRRKIRRASKCPHQHLKLVEIVGYYGRTSDEELAMYFMENAVTLRKIVIDPRHQILERTPTRNNQIKQEEAAARNTAKKQLEGKRPPGVELVIL